ncbi:hypothetical protein LDO32_00585 [Luteimonas sp. Y-2-2-4F]|nr:YSC84-related protein [Luteimonas sp. Y-2-2-4F]MCD9030232.1 hypothetical protein [Luteimonas sp. Y-2-2-4F]
MRGAHSLPRTRRLAAALLATGLALTGVGLTACSTTAGHTAASPSAQRAEIDSAADAALQRLYENAPDARQLVRDAKGVLIFPTVVRAGFVVGGEYGRGVLRVGNQPAGYYRTAAGSLGLQAGAQSSATILLFMTDESLAKFRSSNGWTAGADATVAVAHVGANGNIDTQTAQQSVIGFVLNNAGLMAGVSLEGSRVTRITDL